MLTEGQRNLLKRIDLAGSFSKDEAILLPNLHFCPDWDFLPVCDDSPEAEGCTCHTSRTASSDGAR